MLDFVRSVTDAGAFRHMTVDMFVCDKEDGSPTFLVNELPSIVGFRDVPENKNTGRWQYDPIRSLWAFERGRYHHNECANLRVRMLLPDCPE